jgi:hypothetical protein
LVEKEIRDENDNQRGILATAAVEERQVPNYKLRGVGVVAFDACGVGAVDAVGLREEEGGVLGAYGALGGAVDAGSEERG